jgi:hypothetical protein
VDWLSPKVYSKLAFRSASSNEIQLSMFVLKDTEFVSTPSASMLSIKFFHHISLRNSNLVVPTTLRIFLYTSMQSQEPKPSSNSMV